MLRAPGLRVRPDNRIRAPGRTEFMFYSMSMYFSLFNTINVSNRSNITVSNLGITSDFPVPGGIEEVS